jgi:hypothetical protein
MSPRQTRSKVQPSFKDPSQSYNSSGEKRRNDRSTTPKQQKEISTSDHTNNMNAQQELRMTRSMVNT